MPSTIARGNSGSRWLRRAAYITCFAAVGAYAVIALRGPQGLPALLEKRREVQALQEQNANMQKENEHRRDRIKRLKESQSEQEMEIRQKLKLLHPGETSFILPEQPKTDPSAPSAQP